MPDLFTQILQQLTEQTNPKIKSLTVSQNEVLRAVQAGGCITAMQAVKYTGFSRTYVEYKLKELLDLNRIYIKEWRIRTTPGGLERHFAVQTGSCVNALKPEPLTKAETARRCREKLKSLGIKRKRYDGRKSERPAQST